MRDDLSLEVTVVELTYKHLVLPTFTTTSREESMSLEELLSVETTVLRLKWPPSRTTLSQ